MSATIPLCAPSVTAREVESVLGALHSGWVAPVGPQLTAFEQRLAELSERPAAVAVSSGTAALHLALVAAGVRSGDSVAVATLTFVATTNALAYIGANPVFIDCDDNGLISPELLEAACMERMGTNGEIRAIMPVDLYGRPADYVKVTEIAARYGATVVADAAESVGARLGGRPSARFGDFAAVSFNGNKIVTTSSGGAVLCPDHDAAEYVHYLATQARNAVPHYEHARVGYNYRLSNILAALGLAQLDRLAEILRIKRAHYHAYQQLANSLDGLRLLEAGQGNCWLTVLICEPHSGSTAQQLGVSLAKQGIEARAVFLPMHLQPVHAGADTRYIDGTAERLYRNGLALPSSTDLTNADRSRVLEAIADHVESRSVA